MNYDMTTPCDKCPFLKDSGFTYAELVRHASGEFACHKTCKIKNGVYVPRNSNTPHCAGALAFNENRNAPHQMMRIAQRLGMYDRTKLNMKNIGSTPKDYRQEEEEN